MAKSFSDFLKKSGVDLTSNKVDFHSWKASGSTLPLSEWIAAGRPSPNRVNSPLNLGSVGGPMPGNIWEGATQEDTEMSQWMSSGSNLDFGDWLTTGKPEAFDTSPLVSSPTTSQPDYNSRSGPELTAYLKQQYPEQYSSKSAGQIPVPGNRTVPITKKMPKMFDESVLRVSA